MAERRIPLDEVGIRAFLVIARDGTTTMELEKKSDRVVAILDRVPDEVQKEVRNFVEGEGTKKT